MVDEKVSEKIKKDDSIRYGVNCYPIEQVERKDDLMESIADIEARTSRESGGYQTRPWTDEDFEKAEEVLKEKGYGKTLEDLKKLFQS